MGTYQVKRSCGHTEEVKLYGRIVDRPKMLEFEEGRLCHACYLKQRAEEAQKAHDEASALGFQALEGSEKQVAWAETLRMKVFKSLVAFREFFGDKFYQEAVREFKKQTKSGLYICYFKSLEPADFPTEEWVPSKRKELEDLKVHDYGIPCCFKLGAEFRECLTWFIERKTTARI